MGLYVCRYVCVFVCMWVGMGCMFIMCVLGLQSIKSASILSTLPKDDSVPKCLCLQASRDRRILQVLKTLKISLQFMSLCPILS